MRTSAVGCSHEATAAKPGKLRYLLILGGLTAFPPFSVDMYLPALPRMSSDLHASGTAVQFTLTAFIIGLAAGQVVVGPLSDSFGRRKPLLIGLVLYCIAATLCALSPSVGMLIAARLLQAFGAAAGIVIARAVVRDLFSGTEMTKFFSTLLLVFGIGPVIAPVLGGQLLRLTSWRGVFVVQAVFGVLLVIAVLAALPESLPADRHRPARLGATLRTYGQLVSDRGFLGYALAGGLWFAGLFAYVSASSFVLQDFYGLSPQQYSLAFGANGIGIVLAGQLNGRLVNRFPERRLLATGLAVGTLGGTGVLLAGLLSLPLPALLIPLFCQVSMIGVVMPNATSLALAEQPEHAGSASALMGVAQFTIGALATPLVGIDGVPMGAVMAGFALTALIVFVTVIRTRRAPV